MQFLKFISSLDYNNYLKITRSRPGLGISQAWPRHSTNQCDSHVKSFNYDTSEVYLSGQLVVAFYLSPKLLTKHF